MDIKEMVKAITAEEIATLKSYKPRARKAWVVKKHGTSEEKSAAAKFNKYPAWADSVVNQINWEAK